jgi:hypothetical protein
MVTYLMVRVEAQIAGGGVGGRGRWFGTGARRYLQMYQKVCLLSEKA